MYIDFHTHGKLAKKLPFSQAYTDWLFCEAKKAGLDAICLTEHFNTLQFDDLYNYVFSRGDIDGDSVVLENGLRIFPGMETDIAQGGHILCIGPVPAILELNHQLEPFKSKDNFLPFTQLMELFVQYPVIIGAGHPFRDGSHIPELTANELSHLHFLDMNGKDIALNKETIQNKTTQLAAKLGIPVVAGSDTHQAVQYGCITNCFYNGASTVHDLYEQMLNKNYSIEIMQEAAFHVQTANLLKRSLKEIYALGGDYVSVLTSETDSFAKTVSNDCCL